MTSKPVNLRQFRKRKAREEKARQAETNRVLHGTPKSLTELEKARREKLLRDVEGKRLEPGSGTEADDAEPGAGN